MEGLPEDGSGDATEIDEDVDADERLRARGSCAARYGRVLMSLRGFTFVTSIDLATVVSMVGGVMDVD